ncbi:MJ0570-related uncharacterized domain-containing protein [Mesonia phycicola]|uniref:MJ0570-related uncharacterized domain-containing protein n=1 Tax=Mesonia phycicola TaxID=579105 RepID=A0A1M6FGX2_9FLAO|nr:diphthine--ammonia ligase [Mesonia phycicola]SHI96842.1 MJ0570-related uncharacterized domain-containing protein [Mesonia phycicola]
MNKTYLNWSSGKDAMLALHHLQSSSNFSVEKLVTTVNSDYNRVSMHGLPISLLEKQAESLQLPLHQIPLDGDVSMQVYNQTMQRHVSLLKEEKFTHTVFGDIFLEDLKTYRENELQKVGVTPVFPLWKKDTKSLVEEFINLGYKAIVVCVNANYLDESFCGRIVDAEFLNDLPENVDACGENGEFHTFVFDGPLFSFPIEFEIGEKVLRDYTPSNEDDCYQESQSWDHKFWYVDLKLK